MINILSRICVKYIARLRDYKNYSAIHAENSEYILSDFCQFCEKRYTSQRCKSQKTIVTIQSIKIDDIEDYIVEVSRRPINKSSRYYKINKTLHPSTVAGYVSVVRCFFKYCVSKGYRCVDPSAIETRKAERGKVMVLTDDERLALFGCPEKYERRRSTVIRNKLFILMLYYTGCRISEIINLTFSDIDLYSNQIQVRGKGGKIRGVFITDEIKQLIRDYRQERLKVQSYRGYDVIDKYQSDRIFVCHSEGEFGKPCTIKTFQNMFADYRKKMESTKPITAHILRHTFATDLMKKGGDVRVVQIMLGHRYLETTMRYTHVSDTMLEKTHSLLK